MFQEKRMYSQNGELLYPSDSEESEQPSKNTDNRAVTPHSNHSLSPTPAKQSTGSPPCARTDSFSPRYSPPNLTNHLDTGAVATAAVSQHDNLTSSANLPAAPNHIDSMSSIPSQADNRATHQDSLTMSSQQAHINPLSSQTSLGANMQHQVYKTSPQASPTAVGNNYNISNTPYQLGSQYAHNLPILNQSQSRY